MKIGFDFDKVFIDYPPLLPAIWFDKFYKQKDKDVLLYRIPSYPEQVLRKVLHLPFLRPPITENLAFLKTISGKNHTLYLISSRFKFLEPETKRLVKKYQLATVFDKLYFNFENKQPHLFKNEIIKKLQLDLYVDDDLSLIRYVAKHNPKTTFFWLNHHTRTKPLAENIFEIKQLPEMLKKNNL